MIYCPVTCGFCTQPPNSPLPPSDPVWNTRCPKKYSQDAPVLPRPPEGCSPCSESVRSTHMFVCSIENKGKKAKRFATSILTVTLTGVLMEETVLPRFGKCVQIQVQYMCETSTGGSINITVAYVRSHFLRTVTSA